MQIKTVVSCVNYDDFLALTLPQNLRIFPSITVLTSPRDTATLALAQALGAEVFTTEAWHIGGPLNKAAALNEWVAHTTAAHPDAWLMTLDADILLPPTFTIPGTLDPRNLCSTRRRLCEDLASFQSFTEGHKPLEEFPLDSVPIRDGLMWGYYAGTNSAGLVGYLQLWHPQHSLGAKQFYATGTAEAYDLNFGLSFPEQHRAFLEDLEVLHIGPTGLNWHGRRTPRWDLRPTPPFPSPYTIHLAKPLPDEYRALRVLAGLSPKSAEGATLGLPNSLFAVIIRLGASLVGMGRIVGDGGLSFQIVDVAVHPDHQGRGLGKAIVARLVERLQQVAPPGAHISLLADGPAHHLYAQFGFRPTAPESIGMALPIRSA